MLGLLVGSRNKFGRQRRALPSLSRYHHVLIWLCTCFLKTTAGNMSVMVRGQFSFAFGELVAALLNKYGTKKVTEIVSFV